MDLFLDMTTSEMTCDDNLSLHQFIELVRQAEELVDTPAMPAAEIRSMYELGCCPLDCFVGAYLEELYQLLF